jgi:hypothetical protein
MQVKASVAAAAWRSVEGPWYLFSQEEQTMRSGGSITHDRSAETIDAKARWFRTLTLEERMDMLCAFTDLALSVNATLQEWNRAQPVAGRIQVLSKA